MLVGTGDPAAFEPGAPVMENLATDALVFEQAEVLHLVSELTSGPMCEMLPPALHPTLPPIVTWSAYRLPETPWGPVLLAHTRIECRSGLRPRGLLTSAVIDNSDAAAALSARWGYRFRPGRVELLRGYDETRLRVEADGRAILDAGLRSPKRIGESDIQFIANLHPATTPQGFRLVQVDLDHTLTRAERGDPFVDAFEATAWGEERLEPSWLVSAAFGMGTVTLPKLRFVCRPDVLAFEGTETV